MPPTPEISIRGSYWPFLIRVSIYGLGLRLAPGAAEQDAQADLILIQLFGLQVRNHTAFQAAHGLEPDSQHRSMQSIGVLESYS